MKKIINGFIGLTASLAIVGVAFALTYNQVSISGLGLTMTDPELYIASGGSNTFGPNIDIPLGVITNLHPGDPAIKIPFTLKNTSNYKMNPSTQANGQVGYTGDKRNLAFNIYIAFVPADINVDDIKNLPTIPGYNDDRGQWNDLEHLIESGDYPIYNGAIEAGQTKDYNMWVKIRDEVDRNYAGMTLSDNYFVITGHPAE